MKSKTENPHLSDSMATLTSIELPFAQYPAIEYPQLLAKLACGLFGITDDNIEKYQSLDQLFIKNKFSTFFFEADGDSMEPTIYAKQILIVDRSLTHFHGKVCVVCVDDKMMCKRVIQKENMVILKSDNLKYKDIVIQNNESLLFWGVVVASAGFIQ